CQACGAEHRRWAGRCDSCGAWNTIVEEPGAANVPGIPARARAGKRQAIAFESLTGADTSFPRRLTRIHEFDRVLGGGLVPGSAILVAGDPGIGKSTLLLQAVAALANNVKGTVVYISGEEAVEQVRLRAARLGLAQAPVKLAAAADVGHIVASLEGGEAPALLVVDSIQTMFLETLESAPGTVAQVRTSAQALIRLAKARGTALVLVGHVTKEGLIAGPRVLEHMVDTVLYFEGERGHHFRILRAVKNRFGPTDEIGVFEMTDGGLKEVANPSALFLSGREEATPGSAVFAGVEGTRPLLVEIQALVAPSALAAPRRAVVGWDSARLSMIIAVLDARLGLALSGSDVYLNVAGGLKVVEPGADLAVAAALLSSLAEEPAPAGAVFFGEVGLAGEVRAVGQTDARLKEAAKLGFERAVMPKSGPQRRSPGLPTTEIAHLRDLLPLFGLDGPRSNRKARAARPAP
ncbi:MAG TPA: DNA repair protein RadA, partial [Alphaproteobacteria bacterium]|nr:DNA repair protein RadA [Alphaproteobacteria bacterium]